MRFVIVTGMSGAGKSTALKMLEDAGYFCVDNLPVKLIEPFAKLTIEEAAEIAKVALGLDVRSGSAISQVDEVLESLDQKGYHYEILFLDADDEWLIRRYKQTRRTHPLARNGRVESGIAEERKRMAFLKERADYLLDTSGMLTRELKNELDSLFLDERAIQNLTVNLVSFGYKHGIPSDADLVFDVRFLPNPYYVDELKNKTGQDEDVWAYINASPDAETFLTKLTDMLSFLIPLYVAEGKYQLVIGIGCTGGHHRSVGVAEQLYKRLSGSEFALSLEHRDIERS